MTIEFTQKVTRLPRTLSAIIVVATCQTLFPDTVSGQWFEEVTTTAGVSYSGSSFGASWGDVNGDGLPDLWVGNHAGKKPDLFANNRDGTFSNIAPYVPWVADAHGSEWVDFDNDGDQDLLMMVGGGSGTGVGANAFYVNSRGALQDLAQQYGLDYPLGRGRTPLWFDWDNNGELDVFLANWKRPDGQAPSALFSQDKGTFADSFDQTGLLTSTNNHYAQIMELSLGSTPALVINGSPFPERVYDYSLSPFVNLNAGASLFPPSLWNVQDSAIMDFNGDQQLDVFVVRATSSASEVVQLNPNTVAVRIDLTAAEKGFSFSGVANAEVRLDPSWLVAAADIYIGSQGIHPSGRTFTLSSSDPAMVGMPPHVPGVDFGVFVGYDPSLGQWRILVSKSSWIGLNIVLTSADSITGLAPVGFQNSDGGVADKLFLQTMGAFTDVSTLSGINSPTPCESVTAGDFDNDMDVDLYLVCNGPATNRDNILYENLGNGTFQAVLGAGGAQGSSEGRGDTVSAADYDEDGFIDLFVTNGRGDPSFNNGPSQLFHNVDNGNHWLEIDLEGVRSNRDGIGAQVFVTANGKAQVRYQGGGMHRFAQDHHRIHFGLAGNTRADSVTVNWPSGITQTISNLPADEIVHIQEPSFPSLLGKPVYQPGQDEGFFLWKDTFDGPYHIDTNGSGPVSAFWVELIADQPIVAVTPRSLETNDVLSWSGSHLTFDSRVSTYIDGLDVQLPPGSHAMLAVEQDGSPNPRQLHVGASGLPLTPSGWIVEADTLPVPPAFVGGQDLGLFMGRDSSSGELRPRWNGDGPTHRSGIELLFSTSPSYVTPVSLEANDVLVAASNAVSLEGYVSTWWDGVNIGVAPGARMGLTYTQDGLLQPHRVNPATRNLGLANAYQLPRAEPYGVPAYDPGTEAGLYLWQDKSTGVWHLRGAAGGGFSRYTGELISDHPFISVSAVSLEGDDVLDTADPTRIVFNLGLGQQWQDGIDFLAAPGAQLSLNLTAASPFSTPAKAVRVGDLKWPVEHMPLDLSGW